MSFDLFTRARLKITFLYFLFGIVIVGIAGYLIYSDLTAIIANTIQVIQTLLSGGSAIDQHTGATIIAENINSQVRQMDLAIGIWLVVIMVFCAYVLAGITLRPVRRAMERQKRFMANISHELRTPLSVMKTSTEATLLGADHLSRDELVEAKESDLEEIDRMAKIIEFLFNFSNIDNRMSKLAFTSVDLGDIGRKAAALMSDRAREKKIAITFESEPATVSGNATALEEVAVNLIKNAIAYTPSGGTVRVTVSKRYGIASLTVRDNGEGIPEKDMPNIFEAFYRGDNTAGKGRNGSSGLGLAIVREIIALHNARITVKSDVGKGTTFTVRFPSRLSRFFTPW